MEKTPATYPTVQAAILAVQGGAALQDAEVLHLAYGLDYGDFSPEDMGRGGVAPMSDWPVRLAELRARLAAIRAATPRHTQRLHADTGLGRSGPGGIYKPDATPTARPCARCGAAAMWIAGAGEALCVRHQDDY